MSIKIKVASSPKELDDVYRLRYDVYVIDDAKFGKEKFPDMRMVDRFDALTHVANIIAYEGDLPIATLRLNKDSSVGLPSEHLYDFAPFRERLAEESGESITIVSCGMLCVHKKWRRRRDVIYALFKMAIGIGSYWNTTHSVATVSQDTVSLYGRMGYSPLSDPIWIDEIGNHIVPMVATYKEIHQWTFSNLLDSKLDKFWLDSFGENFERILLSPGEKLFSEGDDANAAYIIDDGWIALSRIDMEHKELIIATIGKGGLFGELALVDNSTRSATATATTHCELIRIEKGLFNQKRRANPAHTEKLLQMCAQRLRKMDDLAIVMAYAPQTGRVKYALNQIKASAIPDRKKTNSLVVRMGVTALAQTAGVREHEVLRILEQEKTEGRLDYGKNIIRFFE